MEGVSMQDGFPWPFLNKEGGGGEKKIHSKAGIHSEHAVVV